MAKDLFFLTKFHADLCRPRISQNQMKLKAHAHALAKAGKMSEAIGMYRAARALYRFKEQLTLMKLFNGTLVRIYLTTNELSTLHEYDKRYNLNIGLVLINLQTVDDITTQYD